jgi:hypothetical protein
MDAEQLRCLLAFDSKTGVFVWLPRPGIARNDRAGKKAGTLNKAGYIAILINRKSYLAHRLAWLYVYGVWPDKNIDHIDRDRSNNAISNLRLATQAENQQNVGLRIDNVSGCTGVYLHAYGKYEAYITKNSKRIYLGVYETLSQARDARLKARQTMFTHATI